MIEKATGKEVTMLTLSCNNVSCLTKLRIGRFIREPSTRVGEMKFCPNCGGPARAHIDNDETYIETLANSYELPVNVVEALMSIWDTKDYPNFYDFVVEMKKEAGILV